MSLFCDWLLHRSKLVRLSWPDGLAEAAGVSPGVLRTMLAAESLKKVGRGARGYIARALKVSVRELEALSAGRIDWIADERIIDFDGITPNGGRAFEKPAPLVVACPPSRGVPIVGRILDDAKVEYFDDGSPEDRPRLPVRYAGFPDLFALKLAIPFLSHAPGDCIVMRTIPPGEIRDCETVLLTRDEGETDTRLWRVHRESPAIFQAIPAIGGCTTPTAIGLETILRSSWLIASWRDR